MKNIITIILSLAMFLGLEGLNKTSEVEKMDSYMDSIKMVRKYINEINHKQDQIKNKLEILQKNNDTLIYKSHNLDEISIKYTEQKMDSIARIYMDYVYAEKKKKDSIEIIRKRFTIFTHINGKGATLYFLHPTGMLTKDYPKISVDSVTKIVESNLIELNQKYIQELKIGQRIK